MSQLSDFRRKVLKKSQQDISAELGYEKWATYAAQERGENPLPEDVKTKLRGKKYNYQGEWPDEEGKAAGGPYLTEAAFAEWRKYWREGEERVLARLAALEDQVRKLSQQAGSE